MCWRQRTRLSQRGRILTTPQARPVKCRMAFTSATCAWPNPSFEATSQRPLRALCAAPQLKRWAPAKWELACEQGWELNARRAVRPSAASEQMDSVFGISGLICRDPRKSSPSHGLSVLRRPARQRVAPQRKDMEALRTVSHSESEAVNSQASSMNPSPRRRQGSSGLPRLPFAACAQARSRWRRGPTLPSSGRA